MKVRSSVKKIDPDDQIVETYDLRAGELVIKTESAHKLVNGDKFRIIDNG